MIRAIIVDDEQSGINNLKKLLTKHCPAVQAIGEATNISEARELINNLHPSLVFLDIEMPNGTGLDLIAGYDTVPFEVIFVTAFENYSIQALRLSACDYILKPVDTSLLVAAVNKAAKNIAAKSEGLQLKNLIYNLKHIDRERKIALPTASGMIFVNHSDIVYCRADTGYTWFIFSNRNDLLVTKNLGEYETLLADSGFIRVHHANLINKYHVAEFKKGNAPVLIMSNGAVVNVSQRKRDALIKFLLNS